MEINLQEVSQKVLNIIRPEGSDSLLDKINQSLNEGNAVRDEIESIYRNIEHSSCDEQKLNEINEAYEKEGCVGLFSFLGGKADLLLPGMEITKNFDSTRTLQHIEETIQNKKNYIKSKGAIKGHPVPKKSEPPFSEIQSYFDALRLLQSKLSDVQISEEVDMEKKRDRIFEEKLMNFIQIKSEIDTFIGVKEAMLNCSEEMSKGGDRSLARKASDTTLLIDNLLAVNDNALHAVTQVQNLMANED